MVCDCCVSCELKYRVKTCIDKGSVELSVSHQKECCCQDKIGDVQSRGICTVVKAILTKMIRNDSDLTPKRAHAKLTSKRKEKGLAGKKTFRNRNELPTLKQVQGFIRRYNIVNYSNKIDQMQKQMNKNQYNDNLIDDDFFFFGVPKRLGAGTKKDPVHIMLTSKGLMNNLKYLRSGVFQMDGTYRLTKNNYPWIG